MSSSSVAVVSTVGALLVSGCTGPFSALDPKGPSADAAAWLWWGMFALFALVFFVVLGLWFYAIKRGSTSRRDNLIAGTADTVNHSEQRKFTQRWIIWGGLVLPVSAISLILFFGIPAGHSMLPLPVPQGNVLRIEVTGHQWWWQVHYPDTGVILKNEIHIPANTPIDLHLTSADVIHSFWVPKLGGKLDMLPGRVNILRLQADEPGVYRGQCAEFCGLQHAHMQFTVTAHEPAAFKKWQTEAAQ